MATAEANQLGRAERQNRVSTAAELLAARARLAELEGQVKALEAQAAKSFEDGYAEGVLDDLLVALPLGELGYSRYWQYLLSNPDFGYLAWKTRVLSQSVYAGHVSGNVLIRDALKRDDWKRLLIIEHDHKLPPNIYRVHAKATQPIYAATYVMRDYESPLPTWFMWDKERHNAVHQDAETLNHMLVEAPGIYPVDTVPMGATSIDREVLESWPKDQPFFTSYNNPAGSTLTHDIFFCRIAQDIHFQAYIDTRLQIKHFLLGEIDIDYFVRWWNMIGHQQAIERAERNGNGEVKPEPLPEPTGKFRLVTS